MRRNPHYSLTDLTVEQCFWLLYGKGRNGKSTFVNVLRAVLGDYAASTNAATLMVKPHGDDKRNDVAVLRGARFVSTVETEDGKQLAESFLKQLTGEDPISCRYLYAEFFTFKPTFKIWMAANHKPQVRGTDLGIWRRIRLVPFMQTIPLDKVDARLTAALTAEGSGVLNWAIEGFREYRRVGLNPPKAVMAATEEYRIDSDPLRDFFETQTTKSDEFAYADVLYDRYRSWAISSGFRPLPKNRFGEELKSRGYEPARTKGGTRVWRGLKIVETIVGTIVEGRRP